MSLLDFVGGGLPFASEAVVGFDEGRRERDANTQASLLAESERRRRAGLDQQAAELHQLKMDQLREDLKTTRTERKAGLTAEAMQYDPVRGVMINRRTGQVVVPQGLPARPVAPKGPVRGSKEYLDAVRAEAEARAEGTVEGSQGRQTAGITTAIAQSEGQLDAIRRARQGLRDYPDAVGLRRGVGALVPGMGQLGDVINQRTDPRGNQVRQDLANVASLEIKDRSGSAVTISEFPRLAAFIPNVYDTPEKIQSNLDALERELNIVLNALRRGASLQEVMGGTTGTPATPNTAPPTPPASFDAWRASRRTP